MNLSPEALQGIADKFDTVDAPAAPEPVPEPVVVAAPQEPVHSVETSSEPTEDVNEIVEDGAASAPQEASTADSAVDDEEVPSGHRVPYDRFKQVLEARNHFRDERATLEAELHQLRAQAATPAPAPVQAASQATSDDDWLEKYLGGDDAPSDSSSPDPKFQELSDRLQATEVHMARQALDVEVSSAIEQYPGVPRDVILQAVASNPGAQALAVAEQYSSWVAGIEEKAISAYLKTSASESSSPVAEMSAEPKAAPRPSKSGGSVATAAVETAPRSISEGSAALRKMWARNNPFAG